MFTRLKIGELPKTGSIRFSILIFICEWEILHCCCSRFLNASNLKKKNTKKQITILKLFSLPFVRSKYCSTVELSTPECKMGLVTKLRKDRGGKGRKIENLLIGMTT